MADHEAQRHRAVAGDGATVDATAGEAGER